MEYTDEIIAGVASDYNEVMHMLKALNNPASTLPDKKCCAFYALEIVLPRLKNYASKELQKSLELNKLESMLNTWVAEN